MKFNLEKCLFRVDNEKFLGFMLTNRGIEANLDKSKERQRSTKIDRLPYDTVTIYA